MVMIKLEEQDQASRGLSILGTDWLVSKTGDKNPDFYRYNPYGKILNQINSSRIVRPEVAATVINVLKQGRFPKWVLEIIKQNDIMSIIQASSELTL